MTRFTYFPILNTDYMFSHTTHLTCFPILGTGYMFSHTWPALHVYLCLALVTCFPTHDSPYMFSYARHSGYMFSHRWLSSHISTHTLGTGHTHVFSLLSSEAIAKPFPPFY